MPNDTTSSPLGAGRVPSEEKYITLELASKISGYTIETLERLASSRKISSGVWNEKYVAELNSLLAVTGSILLNLDGINPIDDREITNKIQALNIEKDTTTVISGRIPVPLNASLAFTGRSVISEERKVGEDMAPSSAPFHDEGGAVSQDSKQVTPVAGSIPSNQGISESNVSSASQSQDVRPTTTPHASAPVQESDIRSGSLASVLASQLVPSYHAAMGVANGQALDLSKHAPSLLSQIPGTVTIAGEVVHTHSPESELMSPVSPSATPSIPPQTVPQEESKNSATIPPPLTNHEVHVDPFGAALGVDMSVQSSPEVINTGIPSPYIATPSVATIPVPPANTVEVLGKDLDTTTSKITLTVPQRVVQTATPVDVLGKLPRESESLARQISRLPFVSTDVHPMIREELFPLVSEPRSQMRLATLGLVVGFLLFSSTLHGALSSINTVISSGVSGASSSIIVLRSIAVAALGAVFFEEVDAPQTPQVDVLTGNNGEQLLRITVNQIPKTRAEATRIVASAFSDPVSVYPLQDGVRGRVHANHSAGTLPVDFQYEIVLATATR